MAKLSDIKRALNLTVIVAALGYFVDMFDITLFGVVRGSSLKDLGLTDPQELLNAGIHIYNMQMIGMMIGGVIWGMMADRKGRLSVMFGSILLYSLGNIANAFVWNVESYALCRLITGIGLAGELGAAITLVAETLPKDIRGIGTTIVATLGLLGSVSAAYFGQHLHWQTAYIVGGCMGLALLVTRFRMFESGMFEKSFQQGVVRGSLGMLFQKQRVGKYILCILMGVPIYFITGILFTFAPELTKGLELTAPVTAANCLLFGSIGLAAGDLLTGLLSQMLQSRKKAVLASLFVAFSGMMVYLTSFGATPQFIYGLCFVMGCAAGYWAVLITIAAEQFGTNIRGTVTTTVPNFVRGSAVLSASGFAYLKNHVSLTQAAMIVGVTCFALATLAIVLLEETFNKNLDYMEGAESTQAAKPQFQQMPGEFIENETTRPGRPSSSEKDASV